MALKEFTRTHPAQAGLLWALIFFLLIVLVEFARGRQVRGLVPLGSLVVCSALGGLACGYALRAYYNHRGARP